MEKLFKEKGIGNFNLGSLRAAVQTAQHAVAEGVREFRQEVAAGIQQTADAQQDVDAQLSTSTGSSPSSSARVETAQSLGSDATAAIANTGLEQGSSASDANRLSRSAREGSPRTNPGKGSGKGSKRSGGAAEKKHSFMQQDDQGQSADNATNSVASVARTDSELPQVAKQCSEDTAAEHSASASGHQVGSATEAKDTVPVGKQQQGVERRSMDPSSAQSSQQESEPTAIEQRPGSARGSLDKGQESTSDPAAGTDNGKRVQNAVPAKQLQQPTTDSPRATATRADSGSHPADLGSNADMRRAYGEMKKAYDDMKLLLKKSMDECVRLSDEVMRLETQVRTTQASQAETSAALKAAKKETVEASAQAASARKDATAAQRSLEKAQARISELEAQRAEEAGTAELEVLRSELSAAVRKAVAAVEAREAAEEKASAAEAARAAAEQARNEADRLRREAQAEAHAAAAAAEAERNTRAEAEGLTETLKLEQERRARVFNNAVKAAVGRVQAELEAERDELQVQLRDVQRLLADARAELRVAVSAADEAAAEAAARTADAVAAGNLAASAEQAAERAAAREAEAVAAARAAEQAQQEVEAKLAALQNQHDDLRGAHAAAEAEARALREQLARERYTSEERSAELEREVRRQADRADAAARALAAAERQVEQATAAGREALDKALTSGAAALKRVQELEAELQQLRASSSVMSLFQLPSKQDVLAGLGLELWKDDRLRWKSEAPDPEAAGSAGAVPTSVTRPGRSRVVPGPSSSSSSSAAAKVLGVIPLRVWLIVAYLSILHIAVMVSFTRRNDVARLCTAWEKANNSTGTGGGALHHGMNAGVLP